MDFSALKVVLGFHVLPQNPNSRFQKIQIRKSKAPRFLLARRLLSDWPRLAKSRPSFLAATFKMAEELP